ncbi:hypothetical protein A6V39_00560 [Candidatus Mycoplasma haematobovis]|uniref:Uncharacterized protein n=1 Tax=Candidatus Mycoplasma haematobovis TaxID=432608 RepID=A0A1A9QD78_9MOLU|nr:hypothetical protein [Candidatus Mycoplasma haematobovis]OAL10542.1 hypothetical protein A6V39_00560 [Candidatus Mycoplasma haematobovis]
MQSSLVATIALPHECKVELTLLIPLNKVSLNNASLTGPSALIIDSLLLLELKVTTVNAPAVVIVVKVADNPCLKQNPAALTDGGEL